jgi:DNA ligase (NAD+)
MTAEERIAWLRERLHAADRAYYVANEPLLSDVEYDRLMAELQNLEALHPQFADANSPSRRVGGDLVSAFPEVAHQKPMLSLSNSYDAEELHAFDKRVRGLLPDTAVIDYVAELKIDGLAMSAISGAHRRGRGVTRGDGSRGKDITPNLRTLRRLPLLIDREFPGDFDILGEVFLSKGEFAKLNAGREAENRFANPRNAAAGSMKMQDTAAVAGRRLDAYWYFIDSEADLPELHSDKLALLRAMGFRTNPVFQRCKSISDVLNFCRDWEYRRQDLDFETDGVVVKLNQTQYYENLGSTAKSPRWAIAYKFPASSVQTRVKDITWQVGRTGVLTPVAELEPVQLAGTTVKRATLHNLDDLRGRDIRIGDTVEIIKGGDIIPKVLCHIAELRPAASEAIQAPNACPVCHTTVLINVEEVALRCPNLQCPAQVTRAIEHWASRNALDIEGLGEKVVGQLYDHELIAKISDLYRLEQRRDVLLAMEGWQIKKVDNLLAAIQNSKSAALWRKIFGLGIRFVGAGAAKLLIRHYSSVDKLSRATAADLAAIDGIGEKTATSVMDYLSESHNRNEIAAMAGLGVTWEEEVTTEAAKETPLTDKRFVITGTFENMTRPEAQALIESYGGRVSNAISDKTDFLLAGTKAGSKLAKARAANVKVISLDELRQMLSIN